LPLLVHNGLLFLDELAVFAKPVLDSLRQPLETGQIVVARANYNVTYPSWFQLVVEMNSCQCGYLGDPTRACGSTSACKCKYAARISGLMVDRFDLIIEVLEVTPATLFSLAVSETTAVIARRVEAARSIADLKAEPTISREAIAEAPAYWAMLLLA
jgi:magnesium chelatase family protein